MKRLLLLLLSTIMLAACNSNNGATPTATASPTGGTPAPSPQETTAAPTTTGDAGQVDNSGTAVGMMMQEYVGNSVAEIPMFTYDGEQPALEEHGGKNPELEMLNNTIKAEIFQLYNDFNDGAIENAGSIDILSYPFNNDMFAQVVVATGVYPDTNPEEHSMLRSYNFDKTENAAISVDEMMEEYEITLDDVGKSFGVLYEADNDDMVTQLQVTGFVINQVPAKPVTHFLLEVMFEPEGDPYKSFFMYTPDNEELEELDMHAMFDPDVYEMQPMDPPLAYESGEEPSNPPMGLVIDTTGLEELVAGQEYCLDGEGMLMYKLEVLDSAEYDEAAVLANVQAVEPDITNVINVTESDEHSQLTSYPSWLLVYETGSNEDTRHCIDVYIQTDTYDYRVHASVPVDYAEQYHDEIGMRFATVGLE